MGSLSRGLRRVVNSTCPGSCQQANRVGVDEGNGVMVGSGVVVGFWVAVAVNVGTAVAVTIIFCDSLRFDFSSRGLLVWFGWQPAAKESTNIQKIKDKLAYSLCVRSIPKCLEN